MKSHALFTVDVYRGDSVPMPMLMQYGRLRYDCFDEDDPFVNMDSKRRVELDHFDQRPSTLHVMVMSKRPRRQKQLVSAVRLIPTTEDYDLEQSTWGYLTNNMALPKSPSIMEGSRWVGRSSRTYEGTLSSALLMLQLYQLSKEMAFDNVLGVITEKGEQWLERRQANAERDGAAYTIQGDTRIVVSALDIDAGFLAAARRLMLDSMTHWSVSHMAVAAVMD
jgi:N-acyl-L-homoserine lactone synthetase